MKEPKNLMRAEITFILQIKLKNMPIKSNYQELSKLKMFRIKCRNDKLHSICSPVHCILFTVSYSLHSVSYRLVYQRFSFRDLSSIRLLVRSAVDFCRLHASHPGNGKLHCQCRDRDFFVEYLTSFFVNSHTTPTMFKLNPPFVTLLLRA